MFLGWAVQVDWGRKDNDLCNRRSEESKDSRGSSPVSPQSARESTILAPPIPPIEMKS